LGVDQGELGLELRLLGLQAGELGVQFLLAQLGLLPEPLDLLLGSDMRLLGRVGGLAGGLVGHGQRGRGDQEGHRDGGEHETAKVGHVEFLEMSAEGSGEMYAARGDPARSRPTLQAGGEFMPTRRVGHLRERRLRPSPRLG
ncbi:MAG: hypothetical protein ACK56I_04320, partial [bacterium]